MGKKRYVIVYEGYTSGTINGRDDGHSETKFRELRHGESAADLVAWMAKQPWCKNPKLFRLEEVGVKDTQEQVARKAPPPCPWGQCKYPTSSGGCHGCPPATPTGARAP